MPLLRSSLVIAVLALASSAGAASFYTARPDDPHAVYLTPDNFPVHGDGVTDDTAAFQAAIDKVQETASEGIVFVPAGRYRITSTIYVWPSIRVIGYGATRPVLVLAPATPGYQDPNAEKYMVFFTGNRPGTGRGGGRGAAGAAGAGRATPPGAAPASGRAGRGGGNGQPGDAGAGTFYSAMSNIDIEIGNGNAGAVGVRGRYAQHSFLAHMDFQIGSGLAGIHDTGNIAEDLHFHGGQYGVWTQRPSPGWQYTMVDASFDGQRVAAIFEREAGLTLIRPSFANVPTAVSIERGHSDELWMKDGRMENITGPAVIISNEKNSQTEINMEHVVCRRVPVFATFSESGKNVAGPGAMYEVRTFSHGLTYTDIGATPVTRDVFATAPLTVMPAPVASDVQALPAEDTWVNIRTLGAKGDGTTDDTDVFKQAIAAHRAIYIPSGHYVITDTLLLKPDTVLIGFHPSATQLVIPDRTQAFQGVGGPKPLIEAPRGGTNILTGIGLYTNGVNPRAVAAKWMAGPNSMLNDVRFLGGHGTNNIDGTRQNPYNNTHTADPVLARRWDGQYPSLWVTDGGGGTFMDIWTPSTFAQAGMVVSDTTTPGRVYELSSEHHVRHEIQLHHVSNWNIYALQTEEERGEGGFALPLEIDDSSNITIANFFIYRVISMFQPFPWAIEISNSRDIHFRNVHSYSNSKVSFDDTVYDQAHNVAIRQREFAWLNVSGAPLVTHARAALSTTLAPGAKVEKLTDGFYNISGGAVDPAGDFYFVDAHWQRIYKWTTASRQLSTASDHPLDPVNLAIDKAGNILVASYTGNGTVYTFRPEAPDAITVLLPQATAMRPGMRAALPVSDWHVNTTDLSQIAGQFISPDGTTFLPAGQGFLNGAVSFGIKSSGQLRSFGLALASAGQPAYITDESDQTTWVGTVNPDGSLSDIKLFAYQGGEGVAVDAKGNVYIAAGQIYVYTPAGHLIETIAVPERPIQLVFGGKDRRTLFIPARDSLYAVRTKVAGR